jgi:hypothetical protein
MYIEDAEGSSRTDPETWLCGRSSRGDFLRAADFPQLPTGKNSSSSGRKIAKKIVNVFIRKQFE